MSCSYHSSAYMHKVWSENERDCTDVLRSVYMSSAHLELYSLQEAANKTFEMGPSWNQVEGFGQCCGCELISSLPASPSCTHTRTALLSTGKIQLLVVTSICVAFAGRSIHRLPGQRRQWPRHERGKRHQPQRLDL